MRVSHFLTQFLSNQNFIQLLSLRPKIRVVNGLSHCVRILFYMAWWRIRCRHLLLVIILWGLKYVLQLLLAWGEGNVNF